MLMAFLIKALMCIKKEEENVKLIYRDCLPILMLLYIVLACLMLACLMLFAALSNAVCLYNAIFLPLMFGNAFCCYALSWSIDT